MECLLRQTKWVSLSFSELSYSFDGVQTATHAAISRPRTALWGNPQELSAHLTHSFGVSPNLCLSGLCIAIIAETDRFVKLSALEFADLHTAAANASGKAGLRQAPVASRYSGAM